MGELLFEVSIGICAYNEEKNIGKLINNVIHQYLPAPFKLKEIIIVSSGSTDRTNRIVSELADKDNRIKLIIEGERRGKAQALNTLFGKVNGHYLVVISADTLPTQGSLAKLIRSLKKVDVGAACARTVPLVKNKSIMEICYRFLWDVHNRLLCEESRNGTLGHLGGDMWAIKRKIIRQIPPYIINDDAYLGMCIRKYGWKIIFVSDAEVYISAPATPMEYVGQRQRIIIGHKQIKEIIGTEPTTIGALAFKKPFLALKVIVIELKRRKIAHYPKIYLGLLLEFLAQILARINFKKKSLYLKWKQIKSTKSLH